jgi:hypothetical protein
MLFDRTCIRCEHKWSARKERPSYCPKCKSPYWNREKGYRIIKQKMNYIDMLENVSLSGEKWKEIDGTKGRYFISDQYRIFSSITGTIKKESRPNCAILSLGYRRMQSIDVSAVHDLHFVVDPDKYLLFYEAPKIKPE